MQSALLGDLLVLREHLPEDSRRELRAVAAKLTTLYAMTIASIGDTKRAVGWYWTAKRAADASQDPHLAAWVRGREVLRSDYDGCATPDEILALVRRSSGLFDGPSVARMEIMVAAARAYARLGEHKQALDAYVQAKQAYNGIPHLTNDAESMYYLPEWRFRLRGAFVHAMAGDVAAVDQIIAEIAAARPANLLRWGVQMDLNRALADARAGDQTPALDLAITTVERTPRAQHTQTMRQLVSELCCAVPDKPHRDAVVHLRGLVAAG
jgi:tetratricopeptide (TPR) repeat protein